VQDEQSELQFDLTPDPRVLVALTHTPLQPLDALCELVDNAIDSFRSAELEGRPEPHPLVVVELPGSAEVNRGDGVVRIRDNGPGLTPERAELAMRAGFSGNNPFDTLGLFGMGFNIATGKLGRRTTLTSARAEDDHAIEVVLDLVALQEAGSYLVPVRVVAKPEHLPHGTAIEVAGWWPDGNPNSGFIKRLAGFAKPTVREQLGRRYATLLRQNRVRLILNSDACQPFEHCVWGAERAVEKMGHGRIPARFEFDELLGTQRRCRDCAALVEPEVNACPNCGSASFRTLEERVRGWLGVQRFDDDAQFGVDLIRNGRAVRVFEQAAFFTFTDEFKQTVKDYPIDSPYGRLVGEVHLDHVAVDFLKQDFQRSSSEWISAIEYLRGRSSLQPSQPGASENTSYMYKLYQGYRRVRNPGKRDMYMGYWDSAAQRPKRIAREIEREYYANFVQRLPGYYDDAEWWKLVEAADQPPPTALVDCPNCGAQNVEDAELCGACDFILIGKDCINCGHTIPASAVICPDCGADQQPEIAEPWVCEVCGLTNVPGESGCSRCGSTRGTPSPVSREGLFAVSHRADELSITPCLVDLADGTRSTALEVITYVTSGAIRDGLDGARLPLVSFRGSELEIFIDITHPLITSLQVRPQELVGLEAAHYLYESYRALNASRPATHSVGMLLAQILQDRWSEDLELSTDRIREEIGELFDVCRQVLPKVSGTRGRDLYEEMTSSQQQNLVVNWMGAGLNVGDLEPAIDSGQFLGYCDDETLLAFFRIAPDLFFDGSVWTDEYESFNGLAPEIAEEARFQLTSRYGSALEDCVTYLRLRNPDSFSLRRTQASVELLEKRLA
jgi:uncharacterized OB-fold protein